MMTTHLQLEQVNGKDFKNEILQEVKDYFNGVIRTLTNHDSEKYLNREQVAEMLNVSLVTIWAYTKKGILISYRIGTKILYKKSEVIQAMQKIEKVI